MAFNRPGSLLSVSRQIGMVLVITTPCTSLILIKAKRRDALDGKADRDSGT